MIRPKVLCSWNVQLRSNLNDLEVDDMVLMLDILETYRLGIVKLRMSEFGC